MKGKVGQFLTKDRMIRYGKNSVMGIQHLFAMMGATILVPMLCNMSIAVGLISAGVGTLIFFFVTKKKVPVFLGSSFAFMGAFMSSLGGAGEIGSATWNAAMAQVSIAVLCTGLVYVILSLVIKLVGPGFIRKLFPPVVVGPVIIVIGLCLADAAINNFVFVGQGLASLDGVFLPARLGAIADNFTLGSDGLYYAIASTQAYMSAAYLVTAIITAGVIIGFSVFAKGFLKVIPILLGIIAGYITAACFGIISFDIVASSGWVIFQPTEFIKAFGWYGSLFTAETWSSGLVTVIFTFVPIAIVTFMEHLGDINASSIVCGQDFVKDPGVHRTLLGDGLGTMAAGLLGGPCNTTYGENTAVLAITKNYNPYLLALAAVFAIILGVFTKFGAIIGTIPAPVIGGAALILYGMIAANGLKTMVEAKVDFSDSRNMIVCSLILVIGMGMKITGISVNIGVISFSPLATATIVGILVNALFLLTKGKQESGLSGTYGGEIEGLKDEPAAEEVAAETAETTVEPTAEQAE